MAHVTILQSQTLLQPTLRSSENVEDNIVHSYKDAWGRGGLMVSVLDSRASAPGSSPGRGHCVVLLGKTLVHPGV